ncbi:hypothetical protein [Sphingosinicella xenopeptidilytica]
MLAAYAEALEGVPAWAIEAARKSLIRSQWRPSPGEVYEAAMIEVRHHREMAEMRQKAPAKPAQEHHPLLAPSREETDRLNAFMAAQGLSTRFNYDGTTYQA